jgi:signal peptidase II
VPTIRRFVPTFVSVFMPLALVGCDHATKLAAKADLEGGPPRQVLRSVLDLQYVENRDTAFNLLRWLPEAVRKPALIAFGGVAIVFVVAALVVAMRRGGWRATPSRGVALVLILSGAFGNYLDRVFRGYVVDFIHVPHWPVFNVADVFVTAGVALLAWSMLRGSREPGPRPA